MPPDEDTTAADAAASAEADAAFASGYGDKPINKTTHTHVDKPVDVPVDVPVDKPARRGKREAEKPAEVAAPVPDAPTEAQSEFVQVVRAEWEEVRAAAAKAASHDAQLAKLFGTQGSIQQRLAELHEKSTAAPAAAPTVARKHEIPKDAFAKMAADFPELAEQTREAMEAAFAGLTTGGVAAEPDKAVVDAIVASELAKALVARELENLEDAHPDWRELVGAVDANGVPPADNAFRKWLATRDEKYQAKINATESALVISRAIGLFQADAKRDADAAAAKIASEAAAVKAAEAAKVQMPSPKDIARGERIRAAVTPKGDAGLPAGTSENDQFLEGFNSR